MENKLEQLLNSLIEKGWKPFGEDIKQIVKNRLFLGYVSKTPVPLSTLELKFSWALRELVSIDSGLWQFVCENKLIKNPDKYWKRYKELTISDNLVYMSGYYEYRIIESALKDESELESFILNNITIKDAI